MTSNVEDFADTSAAEATSLDSSASQVFVRANTAGNKWFSTYCGPARCQPLVFGRAVVVLVALGAAATLVACGKSQQGSTPPTTIAASSPTTTAPGGAAGLKAEASNGSFSISMPNNWHVAPAREYPPEIRDSGFPLPHFVVDLDANDGQRQFSVIVNDTVGPLGATIQESAERSSQTVVNGLDKAVIDPGGIESATVDGEPARRFTYTVPVSPGNPRHTDLFVRHRDVEYWVSFAGTTSEAFDRGLADYVAMMNSWKWSS